MKGSRSEELRLLILDDDVMTGETIRRVGEFAGWCAVHTLSAKEFFSLLGDWSPDVIALDLLMPEMDGVEVIAELSRLRCTADLIITSGVEDKVLKAASQSAAERGLNIIGLLPKPFSPSTLRSMLKNSVEKRRAGDEAHAPTKPSPQPTVADLRRAIEVGEISLVYQPKIFCKTSTLAGFEALARWSFEDRPVSPDYFIPMAEENGLIDELTMLLFEQALHWLADLTNYQHEPLRAGLGRTHLSFNISALTLSNESLFSWVVALCDELQIDHQRLVFELTESSAMKDAVTGMDILTRLRMQGFNLSIDDFGTGFSSMIQLVKLPFSEIKIDKSFVINSSSSVESRSVARSIADLGQSLGLLTTAEGVEDQDTLDYLQALGCDLAQGYYISKPLNGCDVLAWYMDREQDREAARVASLTNSALLESGPDRRFDRITAIARQLFDVPWSLITLVGADIVRIKSGAQEFNDNFPRRDSFSNETIAMDRLLVVPDASVDSRFAELELVKGEKGIRFYAGYPVCLANGAKAGGLCLMDTLPRTLSADQMQLLKKLASMVELELNDSENPEIEWTEGILSRSALGMRGSSTIDLAKTSEQPVSLTLFSLGQLGNINRRHGRSAGDYHLQTLAQVVRDVSDDSDLVGRYRGAEILLIRLNPSESDLSLLVSSFKNTLRTINESLEIPVNAQVSTAFLDLSRSDAFENAVEEARVSITFNEGLADPEDWQF